MQTIQSGILCLWKYSKQNFIKKTLCLQGLQMCACQYIQLTRDCGGHSAAQGGNSCHGNLLVAVLVWAGVSGSNHVGLEQGALQVDMVVGQGLVAGSQDLLSNVLAALQVVVTIRENLRLDNGDDAVLRKAETKRVKMTVLAWQVAVKGKLLKN